MRALVTGCAGFIGSHLTESLLADGIEVLGIDCFNDNYGRTEKLRNLDLAQSWNAFEFVPIDLARGALDDVVEDCDTIFHLAAEPGVRPSWGSRFELYVRNNVLATQHLLEAMKRSAGKRFVYASSSSVYGDAEQLPTSESVIPAPFSPYGLTKLSGEHLCGVYHANYGIDTIGLRYFSVFGPRQRPDMAFHILCASVLAGQTFEIFGDGGQTRDFTYVTDVVSATKAAGSTPGLEGQVFNIGGGSRISLNDAVALFGELAERKVRVVRQPSQRGDVRDTGADIEAAKNALAYRPNVSFADGIALEWEWFRQKEPHQPVSG